MLAKPDFYIMLTLAVLFWICTGVSAAAVVVW